METLKYAILGLLMKKDMTGYELTKEFNSALFEFWNASHSQIYPKLKALTKEGLIEYHIEITGTVLEKKVYTITDAGKEAFKNGKRRSIRCRLFPKMNSVYSFSFPILLPQNSVYSCCMIS